MKKRYFSLVLFFALGLTFKLSAALHIVTQNGLTFSPQALNVEVGDVVRWVWTGGNHNTTSITVPSGANTWMSALNSGTPQFEYTVTVAGNYGYSCTFHAGSGMVGGFVASATQPSCSVDPEVVQVENTVTVTINGTGAENPLYGIDWGDGSFASNLPSDSHTYEESGDYNICVTYLDQDNAEGCLLVDCENTVTIETQGNECSVTLTVVTDENTVTVTAVGEGVDNGQYFLDWGDETSEMGAEASHTYAEDGEYEICVLYGDMSPSGCTATECEIVTIETSEPVECTLAITATTAGGLNVILTSSGSGAEQPTYSVDWGDGSALGTNPNGAHQYSTDGEYTICVTYSDLLNVENCLIEQCTTFVLTTEPSDCTVTLSLTNTGNTYTATAVGTGAAMPQYAINWGDESTPTIGNTGSHTYSESGEYEICAYYTDLTNVTGCTVFDCQTVDIAVGVFEQALLVSNISIVPNPVAENTVLTFSLAGSSSVIIDILDVLGKKVETSFYGEMGQGAKRVNVNTTHLETGVYFVRVLANQEQQCIRILK